MSVLGIAGLSIGFVCLACVPPSGGEGGRESAVDSSAGPSRSAPWDPRGVHYWIAGCNMGEDLWKFRQDSTTVTCDEGGLALEGAEGRFHWSVYLLAPEIDGLMLEGEGLDALVFRLWWAQDDAFTPNRSVVSTAASPKLIRFDLSSAPAWQAEDQQVQRLRLTWSGSPTSGSRLFSVRAY